MAHAVSRSGATHTDLDVLDATKAVGHRLEGVANRVESSR